MSDEQFNKLLEKLRELKELFQELTCEERWAFMYLAIVMVEGMGKPREGK